MGQLEERPAGMERVNGHAAGLDIAVLTRAVVAPLLAWSAMVGAATFGGYPGVACVTPMAWLMGCWIGSYCGWKSRSAPRLRLVEAMIAGAVLGLLQGAIFYSIQSTLMTVRPDEASKALVLSLGITIGGGVVCALLALATAAMAIKKAPR